MRTLTNKQWEVIAPLLPKQNFKKGGRPRADDRKTIEGIIWILKTGAQWSEIPEKYGSYVTCWRRLKTWMEDGTWNRIWKTLLKQLKDADLLHLHASAMDASFSPSKKGAIK
jgi:transposase